MRISVPVNHNFYEEAPILESALSKSFDVKKSGVKHLQKLFSSVYELKLGAEQLKQVKVLKFKSKRIFEQDEERLILKLYSKEKTEKEYYIQTGLYAGVLFRFLPLFVRNGILPEFFNLFHSYFVVVLCICFATLFAKLRKSGGNHHRIN